MFVLHGKAIKAVCISSLADKRDVNLGEMFSFALRDFDDPSKPCRLETSGSPNSSVWIKIQSEKTSKLVPPLFICGDDSLAAAGADYFD